MSIIKNLKSECKNAKSSIERFISEKKEFDKSITEYKKFREQYFDTRILEIKKNCKQNIEKLQKEEVAIKLQIEDFQNIKNLKEEGYSVIRGLFENGHPVLEKQQSQVKNCNELKKILTGISSSASAQDFITKVKKRLQNLHTILRSHNIKDYRDIEQKYNELITNQKEKSDEILKERQKLQTLKKQSNPLPSTNFAEKIMNSEKANPEIYLNKINDTLLALQILAPRIENAKKHPKNEEIQYYLDYEDVFQKKVDVVIKIKNRFNELINFSKEYLKLISGMNRLDPDITKESAVIEHVGKKLRLLEQKTILVSLKDTQSLAKQLWELNPKDITPGANIKTLQEKIKGNTVKISNLTTPNSIFNQKDSPYTLKTPFGTVRVEVNAVGDVWIYPKGKSVAPSYDVIAMKLDTLFSSPDTDFNYINSNFIDKILDYLKTEIAKIIPEKVKQILGSGKNKRECDVDKYPVGQELLNKINPTKCNFKLTSSQKEAAATLCGILMLSESHQFRNPTFGKLERGSIKRIKQLVTKKCTNPFEKVLANKTGEYIPAHDDTSDFSIRVQLGGGVAQTKMILKCKIYDNKIALHTGTLPRNIQEKIKLIKHQKIDGIDGYVYIDDLPNIEDFEPVKGGKKVSIKSFVETQVYKNLKKIYKTQNRTIVK